MDSTLQKAILEINLYEKFLHAIEYGLYDAVKAFLDMNFDPSFAKNTPLILSIREKQSKITQLLMKDKRVSDLIEKGDNLLLYRAVENSDSGLVKQLLTYTNMNPFKGKFNNPFYLALSTYCDGVEDNLAIIEMFLDDKRIDDPSNDLYEIVEFMTGKYYDKKINPKIDWLNKLIPHVSANQILKIIRRHDDASDSFLSLLRHPAVNVKQLLLDCVIYNPEQIKVAATLLTKEEINEVLNSKFNTTVKAVLTPKETVTPLNKTENKIENGFWSYIGF